MALDTFVLVAAQYDELNDAIADYDAVRYVYEELDIIDTYDAAVISRGADGKVKIEKKHEQPTRDGAVKGLYVGLAVGAWSPFSRQCYSAPECWSAALPAPASAQSPGTRQAG